MSPVFSSALLRVVTTLFSCAGVFAPNTLSAEPIAVRHTEGLMHGFLVLKTLEGQTIADGEETQTAHGDRVTVHLFFHFKDGSIRDDTTVFSQRGTFRLISDHLIQKGPSFKQSIDTVVDSSMNQVTIAPPVYNFEMTFHFTYAPKGEAGAPGAATGTGTGTTGTTTTTGTATKR